MRYSGEAEIAIDNRQVIDIRLTEALDRRSSRVRCLQGKSSLDQIRPRLIPLRGG